LNDLTLTYQNRIDMERENLEDYIFNSDNSPCKVSVSCALKKNTECKYKSICFKDVPEKNASFNYKRFVSFKGDGIKYNKYDLINEGYLNLDDIPINWLTSENHKIQRDCYDNSKVYTSEEDFVFIHKTNYPLKRE